MPHQVLAGVRPVEGGRRTTPNPDWTKDFLSNWLLNNDSGPNDPFATTRGEGGCQGSRRKRIVLLGMTMCSGEACCCCWVIGPRSPCLLPSGEWLDTLGPSPPTSHLGSSGGLSATLYALLVHVVALLSDLFKAAIDKKSRVGKDEAKWGLGGINDFWVQVANIMSDLPHPSGYPSVSQLLRRQPRAVCGIHRLPACRGELQGQVSEI